jgi:hypothetical protein
MILHRMCWAARFVALLALVWLPRSASAVAVRGTVEPATPLGQYMALTMTIDDATTRFELTGPDFCWFAFGFDTTTMRGYSLIIEGTGDLRNPVERNLQGIGNPGSPQLEQNLAFLDTIHDVDNALTTVILERPNDTGDTNDPIFTPSMTSLDLIWSYDSFARPDAPNPDLSYHGREGRGLVTINFAPVVPEPASAALAALGAGMGLLFTRRNSGRRRSVGSGRRSGGGRAGRQRRWV